MLKCCTKACRAIRWSKSALSDDGAARQVTCLAHGGAPVALPLLHPRSSQPMPETAHPTMLSQTEANAAMFGLQDLPCANQVDVDLSKLQAWVSHTAMISVEDIAAKLRNAYEVSGQILVAIPRRWDPIGEVFLPRCIGNRGPLQSPASATVICSAKYRRRCGTWLLEGNIFSEDVAGAIV